MKMILRLALLTVLVAAAFWLWTILFPAPEKIIRRELAEVARHASFNSSAGSLAALADAQKLAGFFNTNLEVDIDSPSHFQQTFESRQEIVQTVLGARAAIGGLTVDFLDVDVTVAPDKQSALADLTAKLQVSGNSDLSAQELKFTFQKIGGKWLITRVQTVREFS